MEVVLISRNSIPYSDRLDVISIPTTKDYTLKINLADAKLSPDSSTQIPASEWSGTSFASASNQQYVPVDQTYKPHSLAGFSPFGSGLTNEFATWTMGREAIFSSRNLREQCEDDMRSFAERSDLTEGFMITTPISDAFGGFTSVLLETLRDDFSKSKVFTTAMMTNASSWKRDDTERSRNQRLLNEALSMLHLEELSSMLLPIQAPAPWTEGDEFARFIRDDLPMTESYSQILTTHLQSMNSELREADGLTTVINQLNWRGDNKIAHLSGVAPLIPPHLLKGPIGLSSLKKSIKDFSILPNVPEPKADRPVDPRLSEPFAQYSVVRGYEDSEVESFGPILESTTLLKEPLSTWVCLPTPYYIPPSSSPIFRGLVPTTGRPLDVPPTGFIDPLSPAALFNIPPPLFPPPNTSSSIQPTSIPILTTLSTTPAARHLLTYLGRGVRELIRVRSSALFEFEQGEYGEGREGMGECRERLETLADGLGAAANGGLEASSGEEEGSEEEDEDWGI